MDNMGQHTCPLCDREGFKHERAVDGHLRWAHQTTLAAQRTASVKSSESPSEKVSEPVIGVQVAAETMADCPHCAENRRKASEASLAIDAMRNEKDSVKGERDTLQGMLQVLQDQAQRPQTDQVPSLFSLIAHCESGECSEHAAEWNDVKARVIERIPDDYVRSRASVLGMVEKPVPPKVIRVQLGN